MIHYTYKNSIFGYNVVAPQFLAVGDISGNLHIMEIPRSLRRATYKEVLCII